MKLILVATVLAAICKAGPLVQRAESEQEWPSYDLYPAPEASADWLESLDANAETTSLVPRTLPNTACPAGQHYDHSVCYKSHIIRSFCWANPRSNREKITDTPCLSDEICVQRTITSTGKTYASCVAVRNLVSWRTSPSGSSEGCTNIHVPSGGRHQIGTMTYDINSNPISVARIRFLGEPGNIDEGSGRGAEAASAPYDFNAKNSMRVCILTNGFGNLFAYSWTW